ncbi:phage virion morphogenesis protein [Variovorax paradoxus]|uniref:Phage virion morphogenesis family protein n=1 Tax=Variovorax paradoxus TaxID=34073 RepID=A0A0H2LY73_VARPD|nr:phage virion morphogenesis protein [Variovorax paradoxus]KLN54726.1 phage virion morphogenesis family protein [Variovorax paradoxus]
MSGVELRAGFNSEAIRLHLARLAIADAEGYVKAREDIGEYMVGEVQDNLDGQKLFDGAAMPQSKAAIARQGKTLIAKHHLYDSYVHQLVPGGVAIGSDLVYAAIHHFGGETGRPGHRFTMKARPVLGVGPAQETHIGDLLIAEIGAMQ